MTDKIFDFILNAVRKEEEIKRKKETEKDAIDPRYFSVEKKAGDLVEPSRKKAAHHREREKYYTEKLAEAEIELREKGVTTTVIDPNTGFAYSQTGSVCSGNIGNFNNAQNAPKFQAVIDQTLLGNVERNKNKMVDHRGKADQYEKYARAFSLAREKLVKLSIEDITYFGLEG